MPLSTCMFKPKLWANSWITFMNPFQNTSTNTPSPTCYIMIHMMFTKLVSFMSKLWCWEHGSQLNLVFSCFNCLLTSNQDSHIFLSIVGFLQCECIQPIAPFGYPCFCCVHDNKCIRTHDAMHDAFAFIAFELNFLLSCFFFFSSRRQFWIMSRAIQIWQSWLP